MTARAKTALPPIELDPSIRSQALRVHNGLRRAIIEGLFPPGARLPSSRALAEALGVGRNMVVAAYEHLSSDGLIEARHGSGSYVTSGLPVASAASSAPELALNFGYRRPFALGQTLVEPAFLARLGAAARRHITGASLSDLAYGDPRGSQMLRCQIADHLAISRGIRCDPDCVVITSGTQHGLRICVEALLDRGAVVGVEDPGYRVSQATISAAGCDLLPVAVDAQGLDVAELVATGQKAKAVAITPSHQFPLGVRMAMERRLALIAWAEARGAWIFEDDYDSEFRYAGPPLTALAGLAPKRVIYLGTFAKTLFPGLRLGYLVVPPEALGRVLQARNVIDRFPSAFLQKAVAELMADGTIAAHLRRNLRQYQAARDLVAGTITRISRGVLRADLPEHGLHMVAWLRPDLPVALAGEIRREAAIEARLISELRLRPGADEGLVLGFSGHDAKALREAATALGEAALRLAGAAAKV